MQYRTLGATDIQTSVICLGTMTYGGQNSEAEAHAQMDAALDSGVNFFDTAEMYPIPAEAATWGSTETQIGNWLKARGNRDRIVLASKAVGPGDHVRHIRPDMDRRLGRVNLEAALDGSLKRLRTDYIDLYQLHWPERQSNRFDRKGFIHDPAEPPAVLDETIAVLSEFVAAGKVRHIGVCNETPWGVMTYLRLAHELGAPRMVSIQNPYNLLNRTFEVGNAEIALREDCGLLAYSPLAFGMLTGKYLDAAKPEGARLTRWGDKYPRYSSDRARVAARAYVGIANAHGLDPAQMAIAFVCMRPFVTAAIIGATKMEQLAANIAAADITLADDVIAEIEAVHWESPNPSP